MDASTRRSRQGRIFGLAAMVALVAMLLPAAAGVALGHTYNATLQCSSSPSVPTLVVALSNYDASYTNSVTITIDGVLDTADSKASFLSTYNLTKVLSPATDPHTAIVAIVAGDNSTYSHTYNLSVPPCQKRSPTLPTTPNPTGPSAIGAVLNDSATVTGGYNPTGSVTFKLYGPADPTCANGAILTQIVTLSSGSASTSPGFTTTAVGTYEWTAHYGGDTNNNTADSGCGAEAVVINPNAPSVTTTLVPATSPVALGASAYDTATIVGGYNPTGTISYGVYSNSTCTTLVANLTPTPTPTANALVAGVAPNSKSYTFTSAGTYYFQAAYSGDGNNTGPVSSACTSEIIVVNPRTPSVTTTLVPATSPVALGASAYDTATIVGGYNPTGTISYGLYSDPACSVLVANLTPTPNALVAGAAPNSIGYTFTSAGTFYFQAAYSGDTNNTGPVSSGCQSEIIVVNKKTPSIATQTSSTTGLIGVPMTVGDTATFYGAYNPTGSVSFTLYGPNSCTTPAGLSGSAGILNGSAIFSSASLPSVTWTPLAIGTYYWIASYAGDVDNTGFTTSCGDAHEQIVVSPVDPTLPTTPNPAGASAIGSVLNDTATVTGGYHPTGWITFSLYGPNNMTCTGTPIYTQTVGMTGISAATSPGAVVTAIGTYYWIASYSGDTNNYPAYSGCGAEAVVITTTSTPTPVPTSSGSQILQGATGTPPTTSGTGSNGSSNDSMPLFALLICFAFGGLGLLAVQTQRRSMRV